MVKLGQLTRVEVNDEVTVMVQMDWGQYKKLLIEIDDLPDDDPKTLEALGVAICPFIRSITGVEDSQGHKVETVTPEVLDTFPPALARDIVKAIAAIGQGDGGVVPPEEDSDS